MQFVDYIKRLREKYDEFGFRVISNDPSTVVAEIDISSVMRKFQDPIRFLLIDSDKYEQVTRTVDEYMVGNSHSSDLFPLMFTPSKRFRDIYKSIVKQNFFADSQPIVNVENFLMPGNPREILRTILLSHSNSSLLSPYRIDDYASKSMFVGREKLLKTLMKTPGDHIVSGPRRIGKTSLVKRLQYQLGPLTSVFEGVRRTGQQILRCSFVDVSKLGVHNVGETIWRAILDEFKLDFRAINQLGRQTKKPENSRSRTDDFKALQNFLSQFPHKTTIILDEVDNWLVSEAKDRWETLERLRSITDGGKANLILVGYESFLTQAANPNFPLKARGETFLLGPLDRSSIRELIVLPMKELNIRLEPENDIVERIWQETSGLPHLTQGICRHLVDIAFRNRERERKSDGKKTKEISVTPLDLTTALDLTSVLKDYRAEINHWDFPLAEGIAGILSFTSRMSNHGDGLSNNGILTELEKHFGYSYNSKEFELALKHLELRFIIRALDSNRTTWEWTNQTSRKNMEIRIEKLRLDRWQKSVKQDHENGNWRQLYKVLAYDE